MSDIVLRLEAVEKHFGATPAVHGVTLEIARGEFFALLGPSGCGKTTLLRLIAGFEQPDTGRVLLDGADVASVPANERPVNTVFQHYALFPHLTVANNVAFGLRYHPDAIRNTQYAVEEMLKLVRMDGLGDRKPDQLSGGQKQRVALARALILHPKVLLLDEPLAALDVKLRKEMQVELKALQRRVGITFIFVTHDQGEAMSLADRVAVMNEGRIEQLGTPAEIYEAPRTSFVAAFIGDSNFFDGTVAEVVDAEHVRLAIDGFPDLLAFNDKGLSSGDHVTLSVRPEKIRILRERPAPAPDHNLARAIVEDVIYLGTHTRYWLRSGEYRLAVEQQHNRFVLDEEPIRWKHEVWLDWHVDDGFMLERYAERDERLMGIPPERVGEGEEPAPGGGRG